MLIKHAMDFLYMCPLIKCKVNWALNSLKVPMELGVNLLNQILVGLFNIMGKALDIISSAFPYRCIKVLKDSR